MIASDVNCSSTLCPLDDRAGQIEIKILYAGMNLFIGKSGFQDRQFIGSKTGTEVGFANKKRPVANGQRALSSFSVYPLLSREHRADRTLMSVPIAVCPDPNFRAGFQKGRPTGRETLHCFPIFY